ncbi:MAG: F0F1 ATP synthase subunit gamma [Legionellaceae bacterium]|nr:F0F1 ATP synthase subunit gamma [Legionellaceae bacterium]
MAGSREIKTKINTVKNTQKITRAMEMVAASKMRKAQQRMQATRPYAEKIRQVIKHIARAQPEYKHPFLVQREEKRIGYIIVSSDGGLCGGLNNNLFRDAIKHMKHKSEAGIKNDLCLIGAKAEVFFKRFGGHVVAKAAHLGEKPKLIDLVGIVKTLLDSYREEKLDAIYLCFNTFVNTMVQKPTITRLLPSLSEEEVSKASDETKKEKHHWDYIYEPEAKQLLDLTLTRYVESQVYQAVVENVACKQAAQMIAMKNATDNAGEIIDQLKLVYNKARQAAITQELAEIVAGAEAV